MVIILASLVAILAASSRILTRKSKRSEAEATFNNMQRYEWIQEETKNVDVDEVDSDEDELFLPLPEEQALFSL